MAKEVDSMVGMNAIHKIWGEDARRFRADPNSVVVPSKLVYTVKPPTRPEEGKYRRRVRAVACGNFANEGLEVGDLYAAGATIDGVRIVVAEASANKWSIGTDDVKNAFLAAPLPAGRGYAMEPPRAAIRAGLAEEGELWVVDAAVYGFKKSPKWWTDHRNSRARLAKWKDDDGKPVKLEGCLTDVNLYKVLKEEKPGTWTLTGLVVFYVDDVLAAGPDSILRGFFGRLGSQWETNGCRKTTCPVSGPGD